VVEEQVALADRAEHVRAAALAVAERGRRDRRPRRVAQVAVAVEAVDLPQVAEVEQPVDVDHLDVLDPHLLDQEPAHVGRHRRGDLEPHDLAEAARAELVLDRAEQVVRLVGDGEVGIAGDPEDVVAEDLHPREELVEVARDHVLERDEAALADLEEARQHLLRHLHAREGLVARDRVAQPHGEAEREVRDVRERAPRADRERRQHREDLLREEAVDLGHVLRGALARLDDPDPVLREPRPQRARERVRVAPAELGGARRDPLDRLERRQPVGAARVDPGVDLVVQAGYPHHRELVEVGGVDREELDPLEQRDALVLGELEHALVEVEP
jgi:hypothetical protein